MQRWEYMTWIVGYADTTEYEVTRWQGGVVKFVNGQMVDDWRNGLRLPQRLGLAGQDGWELVTVSYPSIRQGDSTDPLLIFKRLVG